MSGACLSVYQVSIMYECQTVKLKGLARTQIPTNKNNDVEFPTFGEIAGVNHSLVQWSSLALEEPPSWSWLRPLVQVSMLLWNVFKMTKMWFFQHHIWVQQIWVLFSVWKGNCETFPRKTSHFMSNDCLKLQETQFSKAILTMFYKKMVWAWQLRHLWVASDITIS